MHLARRDRCVESQRESGGGGWDGGVVDVSCNVRDVVMVRELVPCSIGDPGNRRRGHWVCEEEVVGVVRRESRRDCRVSG